MLGPTTPRHPRATTIRTLREVACVLVAATLVACAPVAPVERAPSPSSHRVVVRNYGWDNLNLYLARHGVLWHLGEVAGFSHGSFAIPPRALADVDDVYFIARRVAGRPFRSEPFLFPRGSTAVWTIENQPALSYVALR